MKIKKKTDFKCAVCGTIVKSCRWEHILHIGLYWVCGSCYHTYEKIKELESQ